MALAGAIGGAVAAAAVEYERLLPNTTLLYLGDSGRNVHQDQPDWSGPPSRPSSWVAHCR